MPPDQHIAQFNYARLLHPIDDDRVKGFRDGTAVIGRLAERSVGFVWAYESTGPDGTMDPPIWNDPLIAVNLSVWATLPTLEHFVYKTLHNSFLNRRLNWFEEVEGPTMVLWQVAQGHRPSIDEALDRLAMLKIEGATDRAFDWDFVRTNSAL